MKINFNRRSFLKLASLLPAAYSLQPDKFPAAQDASQPNFIILVCDAWSARNISLYGYPRKTTPLLEKLADKAIVYHNHYAAGNYTFPGTIGLLTGVLQWRHRNLKEPFGTYLKNNLFSLFDTHHRIAYTHNQIAEIVLQKILNYIDEYKPRQELYIKEKFWLAEMFQFDYDTASTAWQRAIMKFDDGYANSLFLSRLFSFYNAQNQNHIEEDYPLGIPSVGGDNFYKLETAVDWIVDQSTSLKNPYIAYYHLLPPHAPYKTRKEFHNAFLDDGNDPVKKPEHILTENKPYKKIKLQCQIYDEFISLVDSEINRFFEMLSEKNALENTWVVITSDHGELFERGITGHRIPTFNNPLIHVPLLIIPPHDQERIDIYQPTSAIDLIPTLLHLSNKNIPDWLEGEILPPYNTNSNPDRPIFSMEAVYNGPDAPFSSGAVMMRQGDYKLTYLFGDERHFEPIEGKKIYQLYNLKTDAEELDNLYEKEPEIAQKMLEIMFAEMKKNGAL